MYIYIYTYARNRNIVARFVPHWFSSIHYGYVTNMSNERITLEKNITLHTVDSEDRREITILARIIWERANTFYYL